MNLKYTMKSPVWEAQGTLLWVVLISDHILNNPCERSVFAMHIHMGESCTGTPKDFFADTGGHYNPEKCPHPAHAGDLPPLFGNDGYAWGAVLTNRFAVSEIIGKSLVIHSGSDDFMTQPSGNSGNKIACGIIRSISVS